MTSVAPDSDTERQQHSPKRDGVKEHNFQLIETNGILPRAVVEGNYPLGHSPAQLPAVLYLWRHQITPLAEVGFQVAAPDQRGYGGSNRPPRSKPTTALS